jgi:hypothetical protein
VLGVLKLLPQVQAYLAGRQLIEKGLNALLNSDPDPVLAQKIKDLRSMFMDAYTGWLEIEDEAA